MKRRSDGPKRVMVALLGTGKRQNIQTALFCIVLSLLAGSVLLLLLGKNPLLAYKSILQGAGFFPKARYAGHRSMLTDFMSLLNYTTPMVFASLSVAVALRCGLFNICVSGMMVASGFVASVLLGYSSFSPAVARPLVVLVGLLVGGGIGAVIGWLKYRYNTNEVVVAIMCNYIISYVVSFFIQTRYIDPTTRQSLKIGQNARLTLFDQVVGDLKMEIPLVLPLAIVCVLLLSFLFSRARLGFELKAVGMNRKASRYAGIAVGKTMVTSMVISGALAGLAGVSYYLGCFASIQPKVLPSLGFDAIAVALLGNSNPWGCFFASLLVMTISNGTTYMASTLGVLREIASLITGILLLFSACGAYLKGLADRYAEELEEQRILAVKEGGQQ
ncbi:MAG: ABC transporter permease [Sphaerochaeta sp.]|jgi:simple sugar transport system permease protein|nr:ABC transporter permease [Sphaerochaeta sp.]MCH3920258.1 ABC transporter permease [Sphaerochaeta sp.]MCI2045082.1 ABC transporter permease [Sphaerochaeta sp.]MCI2076511.1 ABC transporter permease [Sphaerochaeta sp.]MCI2097086.1 ABC transporter permease [Sphaerochaeta sp.]